MITAFPQKSSTLTYRSTTSADVPQLVEVYNSNPFFMEVSEGKSAVTSLEVARDLEENQAMPGSYSISVCEMQTDRVIGILQFILKNPRDGHPWLGLLMIHQEKQGRGMAAECLHTLIAWYRENGFSSLHLGVLEKNERVVPFYEKHGFVRYELRATERMGNVICMSRDLSTN